MLSEQFPALVTFLHRNMETHTCENHPPFPVLLKRLEKVLMLSWGRREDVRMTPSYLGGSEEVQGHALYRNRPVGSTWCCPDLVLSACLRLHRVK